MDKKFEPLFTPWKIGKLEIKNRIVLCPMGGTSLFGWMEKHHFDEDAADFFMQIAKNNTGLLITGIAPLKNMMGGQWLYKADGAFKKLKPYMEEFHKTGAKLFVQLTAGFGRSFSIPNALVPMLKNKFLGKIVKPIFDVQYLCASPSKLPSRWAEGVMCPEITKKQINKIVEAYAKTALKCKEAGVDGVEIHAVHEGYLIDQFTTGYTNKRTDEYGGSFENRYRFAVDIVKAIKAACGEDYPVSVRYSVVSKTKGFCEGAMPGEKFVEVGRDMKESEKAAKYLQEAGYDMLNADNGTYDAWYWAHPPQYMPNNCNLEDVSHIRKFVDIPVVCAGKMDPATAAKAIKAGKIDGMGVARQFLVDNQWVTKLMEGRCEDIQPCIHCHNACLCMSHYKGVANACAMADSIHMSRCALNPMTMDGGKHDLKPAKKQKKIAVVGGGVGGMEVARVATLRGHKVTIYEKADKLGGVFIAAAAPDFKDADKKLIEWYRRQIKNLGIEVKFNTEITDVKSLDADEIVIATGAVAKKLPIKGFEKSIEAVDYLNGKEVGENVVVIGGGQSGCEIAYDLFLKGKNPIIIESMNDIMASPKLPLMNTSYLRDFFKTNKVPVYLESKCKEITNKTVIVELKDGTTKRIKCDNVIVAVGYNPAPLCKESKNIHIVGDALSVGSLRTVVWRAWDVAEKL
ncbi:MAG: FAD-dependent oxidoreductase [Clostridia bacterium]|nr:FAD-dependent oxidoreductase [Clostridia bacterium]